MQESWDYKIKDFLLSFIGIDRGLVVVGVLLAAIPFFIDIKKDEAVYYILATYIAILAALIVWREFVYSRKARYAEAMAYMHRIAHVLRDAHYALANKNEDKFNSDMAVAVNSFAAAFSLVTGTRCRACIKTILADERFNPTKYFAEDFCRSEAGIIADADRQRFDIRDNTDFELLFSHQRPLYICNDLSKENPYNNSNWPKVDRRDFFKKKNHSYIASIVWPIRAPAKDNQPTIVGFLCIDSLARGVFDQKYDKDFGAVFADTLHILLAKYLEFKNSVQEPNVLENDHVG